MRAVLYTEDFLPITVIEVGQHLERMLRRSEMVMLAVPDPIPRFVGQDYDPISDHRIRTVRIWGERFHRRGLEQVMLFTNDEELALALRPEYLPGQLGDLQDRRKSALAEGFMRAVMMLR